MGVIAAFQFIATITGIFPILINYEGCIFSYNKPCKKWALPHKTCLKRSQKTYFIYQYINGKNNATIPKSS